MNLQETTALVGLLAQYQPQQTGPEAVAAWGEALDVDMDLGWAVRFVRDWAASNTEQGKKLLPGNLNRAWIDSRAIERNRRDLAEQRERLDSHCGKRGCPCTHGGGCYRGWIDRDYDSHATSPCPVCRGSLASVLTQVPAPGSRTGADMELIRTHASC